MKITIITVGKIKETYIQLGIEEFSKRLSRYCKLALIEVVEQSIPDVISARQIELLIAKEGSHIMKKIKENMYVIVLDLQGETNTSEQFAKKLDNLSINGVSHIAFIIGGSLGLASEVKKRANIILCFSKMTFPHQLFKLILLEQIYRSYRINRNEPYHK